MKTTLFSLIPKERIDKILSDLHHYTGLMVRLLDADGEPIETFGTQPEYCTALGRDADFSAQCALLYGKAGKRAQKLGESYIFTCHAGLNYIVFPFAVQEELIGSVLTGPFLMEEADSTLLGTVTEQAGITPSQALELYDSARELPYISPEKAGYLGRLTDDLFMVLMPAERVALLETQEKLYQQSRLNEAIQMYKDQDHPDSVSFLYDKEQLLMTKVKTGNIPEAKALLNDLLGYVLFSEGGKLEAVRIRAIELTILLSRIAIEGGARADSIYDLNSRFLSLISREQSFEHICLILQDVVESFMNSMFSPEDKGNPYARQALLYVAANYQKSLSVESVASRIGLSPNYFSRLFQNTVGVSFREHLNRVRIEESRHLLISTDYPLTDIAIAVGFSDQSYFCRVFKKLVGVTPGQYRR